MVSTRGEINGFLVACIAVLVCSILADAEKIGVCYGMNGDNLPPADQVANLVKNNNIEKVASRLTSSHFSTKTKRTGMRRNATLGFSILIRILFTLSPSLLELHSFAV
eukprot:Gb_26219 [translate_table: standard]